MCDILTGREKKKGSHTINGRKCSVGRGTRIGEEGGVPKSVPTCRELVTGPGADAGMDGTDHLWMHMRRRRRGGGGGGGGGSRTGGGVSAEFAEYGMATEREDGKKHARLLVECED